MLLDALSHYCPGALPMHMPGHKRNVRMARYLEELNAGLDITEIDGFDDLHAPEGILRDSMRAAARLWGSDACAYLVNGSTCGVLAAVYALSRAGESAVVARNCHKSVYHALEITGVKPRFVLPEFDARLGVFASLRPEEVAKALNQTPNARFVLLTSPTYEGAISDISGICREAHARGVPVIVDEAHGAHLGLSPHFPVGAVAGGADIAVQSLHKTLPSLTQTAILHTKGALVDENAVFRALDIFETSSPSYLLLSSVDGCVRLMAEKGCEILRDWRAALDEFHEGASRFGHIDARALGSGGCFAVDPGKIVLNANGGGMRGAALMKRLREEHHIELEMALDRYALAMTGAGDTRDSLSRLLFALQKIDAPLKPAPPLPDVPPPALPEARMSFQAALSARREMLPLREAEGRVSAGYAWAYPPGVPLIAPGEVIPRGFCEAWRALRRSGARALATFEAGETIGVVREE